MSLRPHFIKISDVLVRGIARSTVKREMLRSLRHIAETIDAVMVAEGIEHVEDVAALRDLDLRYGQGYYMARPAPPFVTLKDEVRAELRAVTPSGKTLPRLAQGSRDSDGGDDDDEDDRELAIPLAQGSAQHALIPMKPIPRNAFGKAEDEITGDYQMPGGMPADRPRPRASRPPTDTSATDQPPMWQPLRFDDEHTESEALIESLKKPAENPPTDEPGQGRPGLN
jgi:hypothetical protein